MIPLRKTPGRELFRAALESGKLVQVTEENRASMQALSGLRHFGQQISLALARRPAVTLQRGQTMGKRPMTLVVVLLSTLIGPARAADPGSASAMTVTIHRDQWGVPHVYGPTDASVVFGYVYAQAEDNFWQVEDTMIQAIGRYAEINGEAAVGADYLNRALRVVELSKAEWQQMDSRTRGLTRAAADGLNAYLKASGTRPRLIEQFEPWHFVAYARFATYQLFVFNRAGIRPEEIARRSRDALTTASFDAGSLAPVARHAVADAQAQAGSNTWGLAPSRTRSGNAMLFINPHQPYFGPGQWYEGHVHSDEGLHFSGAGFFGSPLPTIGHNEHLGWSHTVNEPDIVDVYRLTMDRPQAPGDYRYGEGYRTTTQWTDSIEVKTAEGVETRTFSFERSHHGPIVATRDGQPLAVRMARFEEGGQLEQRYQMLRASNLDEFKSALGRLASPMFNTMYADDQGNIYYAYYGAVPRRDPGFDWSMPVDGSDPAAEWQGYHPLEELPTLTNPEAGYLQNCNATPFLATGGTGNLDAGAFPAYMAPEPDNNRSRMSRILLGGDRAISFEQLIRLTWDTRVLEADTMIPVLAQELAARDLPQARQRRAGDALRLLERWDRHSNIKSRAMTLYFYWRYAMRQLAMDDPVAALEHALDYMDDTYGSWKVAWGQVNRLQRRHTSGVRGFDAAAESLPVAGGPGNPFGMIFNFYARPEDGNSRMYGIAGHSFVSLVEFGETPTAQSILVFGSDADPDSPHYFDQARLFARQRYKPAWFTREQVRTNTESMLELRYAP
jgi:penicillin amidase